LVFEGQVYLGGYSLVGFEGVSDVVEHVVGLNGKFLQFGFLGMQKILKLDVLANGLLEFLTELITMKRNLLRLFDLVLESLEIFQNFLLNFVGLLQLVLQLVLPLLLFEEPLLQLSPHNYALLSQFLDLLQEQRVHHSSVQFVPLFLVLLVVADRVAVQLRRDPFRQ